MRGIHVTVEELRDALKPYLDHSHACVDKLRTLYANAGLSIRSKIKTSKIELIKEYIRALGVNPEAVLIREALAQPARTYSSQDREDYQLKVLSQTLKEALKREPLQKSTTKMVPISSRAVSSGSSTTFWVKDIAS